MFEEKTANDNNSYYLKPTIVWFTDARKCSTALLVFSLNQSQATEYFKFEEPGIRDLPVHTRQTRELGLSAGFPDHKDSRYSIFWGDQSFAFAFLNFLYFCRRLVLKFRPPTLATRLKSR